MTDPHPSEPSIRLTVRLYNARNGLDDLGAWLRRRPAGAALSPADVRRVAITLTQLDRAIARTGHRRPAATAPTTVGEAIAVLAAAVLTFEAVSAGWNGQLAGA